MTSYNRVVKKSGTFARCQACGCGYEVKGFMGVRICDMCREIKKCVHGVLVTDQCAACYRVHGNKLIRVM